MASQEEKRDSVQLEEKESNKEQKHDKEDSNERSNPLEYSSEENDTVDGSLSDLLQRFGLSKREKIKPVLEELTIKGIAEFINEGKANNIVVMTGAGLSTAAGIPDFRSPGTGLYSQLAKYNLPYPESIFTLDYFRENPKPFYHLAKELYPGNFKPTLSHYFITLLERKGLLKRNFTQNIDGLEILAGLPEEKLVAAHGTFHSAHCISCQRTYTEQWVKDKVFADVIPKCSKCDGVVKPDIVFFGEALPERFFRCMMEDFQDADLLIVMGTALKVQPFASLIDRVKEKVPRLLINKEKCGESMFMGGFVFDGEYQYRDVAFLDTCDNGCDKLAELLGWKDDLQKLVHPSAEG